VSVPVRTYELRLLVALERPGPALETFLDAVRELADGYPGIEPLWTLERTAPRVHAPPRFGGIRDNGAGWRPAGRSTR
jgi:hypothetical protein